MWVNVKWAGEFAWAGTSGQVEAGHVLPVYFQVGFEQKKNSY
jgi:hypothetical protein